MAIVDVLAVLPSYLEWIAEASDSASSDVGLHFLRFLRVFRVIRVLKAFKMLRQSLGAVNKQVTRSRRREPWAPHALAPRLVRRPLPSSLAQILNISITVFSIIFLSAGLVELMHRQKQFASVEAETPGIKCGVKEQWPIPEGCVPEHDFATLVYYVLVTVSTVGCVART